MPRLSFADVLENRPEDLAYEALYEGSLGQFHVTLRPIASDNWDAFRRRHTKVKRGREVFDPAPKDMVAFLLPRVSGFREVPTTDPGVTCSYGLRTDGDGEWIEDEGDEQWREMADAHGQSPAAFFRETVAGMIEFAGDFSGFLVDETQRGDRFRRTDGKGEAVAVGAGEESAGGTG